MMKVGTLLAPHQAIPDRLLEAIQMKFPDKRLSDLTIRYYESVEDVGYEYYMQKVLPTCTPATAAHYLAPFISYTRLGEALVLDQPEGLVVYETEKGDRCTETGPFWLATPR